MSKTKTTRVIPLAGVARDIGFSRYDYAPGCGGREWWPPWREAMVDDNEILLRQPASGQSG